MSSVKVNQHEQEKKRIEQVLKILAIHYPQVKTGLVYDNSFQLFVATVLSAQTTDQQVNKITARLFEALPTAYEMARIKPSDLEPYLKRVGLYRHKASYLVEASKIIVEQHGGRVPDQFAELIKLPGVGRKTANIIISSAYGQPALAVDTHVFRVSRRLGLADGKNVDAVEEQLKMVIPQNQWIASHHRLIAHGRTLCQARNPQCKNCFLNEWCFLILERGNDEWPLKN